VSSSISVTVAPTDGVAGELADVDNVGARKLVLDLGDAPSLCDCSSLAAWYSAFSDSRHASAPRRYAR